MLFSEEYYSELDATDLGDVIVDVLNANGITGYAGRTGEKIRKKFSYRYNAANNDSLSEYSYIINKGLPQAKIEELVMSLGEKYFRIKEKSSLPTLANVVVILGSEKNNLLNIDISGKESVVNQMYSKLNSSGYINLKKNYKSTNLSKSVIEYSGEDYYIAYKLGEKIGIKNMVENNKLNNKINILVK